MSARPKSHKAMGDFEWMTRLEAFSKTGSWPSGAGNRPAPRQRKWHDLYRKIAKCPLQTHGQPVLSVGSIVCSCGFHASESVPVTTSSHATTSTRVTAGTSGGENEPSQTEALAMPRSTPRRLSKFAKSRFGESMETTARLKPNLVNRSPSPSPPPSPKSPSSTPCTTTSTATMTTPKFGETFEDEAMVSVSSDSFWLPFEMAKTIPKQDQKWISNALFDSGRLRTDLKLWYEPPVPPPIYHQTPAHDRFFTHCLMVWMPHHMWQVRVSCPFCGKNLTGNGVHKKARKVLDIDRFYLMVTETLRCTVCSLSFLSSSQTVRDQLNLPHQKMFRLLLTPRFACDIRVIRLLRDRTLGHNPARLEKQLRDNHGEEWLNKLANYLREGADFVNRPSLFPAVCQEPPEPIDIPSGRWLLSVYGMDILSRLDNIKASITSTFGKILKMGSTKQITKKLAGHGRGTVTSIGNEVGQILTSVLTQQEGPGLDRMVAGVMQRYHQSEVPPPVLLYVDHGCCKIDETSSELQEWFGEWPNLQVRLDIWQFMQRMTVGCTSDAHALYPAFMRSLSACIYEWNAEDVQLLRRAKRRELMLEGVPGLTDLLVDKKICKREFALYCRRKTRGEEATIRQIEQLLQEMRGTNGRDLMGVPLLDDARMDNIWCVQKRHVRCIQDMPGVPLYTEMGTKKIGEVVLTKYRCARGSTSLESFHCHLNRFIPGTSANALNFQLYLLEGLNRWNQDQRTAAVERPKTSLLMYSGDVATYVNMYSQKVLGRQYVLYKPPTQYTGELLGVDYLLSQTGQPLGVDPDSEETEELLEDVNVTDDEDEDEGYKEDHLNITLLDSPGFHASQTTLTSVVPAPDPATSASSQPAAAPSAAPVLAAASTSAASSSASLAVNNAGIPGIVRVDSPAKFLVGIRSLSSLTLKTEPVRVILQPPMLLMTPAVISRPPQALRILRSPLARAPEPAPVRKTRTRKVEHNACRKCGQFRTKETGHSQYRGTIYCPSTATVSKEKWLKDAKKKNAK